jgi:predicted GNAT family N-acyltransferase
LIDRNSITVEPASWQSHREILEHIRRAVFIEEQAVPESEEWDSADPVSIHALAWTANRDAVGTGRLDPMGKIGRLAVLKTHRGYGVGALLLRWLIDEAARRQLHGVFVHAQTHALPFYRRFGFMAEGAEFDEVGILHQKMRLELHTNDGPKQEIERHGQPDDPDHAR